MIKKTSKEKSLQITVAKELRGGINEGNGQVLNTNVNSFLNSNSVSSKRNKNGRERNYLMNLQFIDYFLELEYR